MNSCHVIDKVAATEMKGVARRWRLCGTCLRLDSRLCPEHLKTAESSSPDGKEASGTGDIRLCHLIADCGRRAESEIT